MSLETVLDVTKSAGADYLDRAKELAPLIRGEADEMERTATITPAVADALREKGLYWMLLPADLGGGGLGLTETVAVLEEISRADGSTGWALMAPTLGIGLGAGYLPTDGAQELYGGDDKAVSAGFSAPFGKAVRVEGGYRAKAKLQFLSGSAFLTYVAAGLMVVDDEGKPELLPNGEPNTLFAYFPRENVEYLGGWDVMGMVGTGSIDYEVPEQFLPERRAFSTASSAKPNRSEGVFSLSLISMSVAGHAAVTLGIMGRALEEIADVAKNKARLGYAGTIGEHPLFAHDFAVREAEYQAARAFAYRVFQEAEDAATLEGGLSDYHDARVRQVSTWVHNVADQLTSFTQLWGGSKAFRNPSALGRATRDIATAKTHLLVDQSTLIPAAGPILAEWRGENA
ncbi:acyl-CoA dehydrogenase family protein [Microbacterium sp. LWH7-1.2]|uniref:acyl-CoA dehydrogenase family protein n=1 Tax=Microbacterium sp. LWH7-1.2 TaxID=3135257 RepID=UPI0031396B2C